MTYALTIWQPWATLIMAGAKPYEFRRWAAPRHVVGQRIVIHAGSRKVHPREVAELLQHLRRGDRAGTGLHIEAALPILERVSLSPGMLPLASGLGTAVLGRPRRATELFGRSVNDSDRVDHSVWAWPLTDIQRFEPPIPARGAQGFWPWREAEEAA